MIERPILFSAPMVRAILDGSKTQTRRVVKPQPVYEDGTPVAELIGPEMYEPVAYEEDGEMVPGPEIFGIYTEDGEYGIKCPYGQPGDRLWVREAWQHHPDYAETVHRAVYRADPECKYDVERWRPSIHMPRWASRIQLEITGVRVERLQDISEADSIAEGLRVFPFEDSVAYAWKDGDSCGHASATGAYRALWESINGPGSWEANPWVWMIDFKRIKP